MLVKEQRHDMTETAPVNRESFRTSVTVDRENFEIFRDICKSKYDKDPINTGINEAIELFIDDNKEYLKSKYSKMKEILE